MADQSKKSFVSRPVYPGGKRAMSKFIKDHLRYPEAARAAGVEGKVRIRYSLDYRGVVVDTRIKSGIGYGCDEEAERVVRLLRFEVPQERKRKVRIHQDLEIQFKLDRKQTSPARPPGGVQSIQYTYQPKTVAKPAAEVPPAGKKPVRTYHYTISVK